MDRAKLLASLERLGAPEPTAWEAGEPNEGFAQLLARFVFLKGAWQGVLDANDLSWMDRLIMQTPADSKEPFAGTAHALRRLLQSGADRRALHDLVRGMQAELVFDLCYLLDDPGVVEGNDVVAWQLYELDEQDQPVREISGLHESVLGTDPTGREMCPE